jgi:hypothetical protein
MPHSSRGGNTRTEALMVPHFVRDDWQLNTAERTLQEYQ